MPVRPEVRTNLFESAIIVNGINPATGVAAPFTYDSNVGNVAQIAVSTNEPKVLNMLLTLFGWAVGVTLDFEFNESDTAAPGSFTTVENTDVAITRAAASGLYMARLETQFMTKSFLGCKLVLGGAGSITQINGTWIEHNFPQYPHVFRQFGNIAPYKVVDLNQKEMWD